MDYVACSLERRKITVSLSISLVMSDKFVYLDSRSSCLFNYFWGVVWFWSRIDLIPGFLCWHCHSEGDYSPSKHCSCRCIHLKVVLSMFSTLVTKDGDLVWPSGRVFFTCISRAQIFSSCLDYFSFKSLTLFAFWESSFLWLSISAICLAESVSLFTSRFEVIMIAAIEWVWSI